MNEDTSHKTSWGKRIQDRGRASAKPWRGWGEGWCHVQGTEGKAVWLKHKRWEEEFIRCGEKVSRGISYGFGDQSDKIHFMASAVESHWMDLGRRSNLN